MGVADALRDGVHLPLHDRRPHGPLPRDAERRHPPDRHVLRRRALPLRHDGRDRHRLPRRPALLVAEDDGQDARRVQGEDRASSSSSSASTSRSCRSSSWARAACRGATTTTCRSSSRSTERRRSGRGSSAMGLFIDGLHAARGALEGQEGAAQPVGLGGLRVDDGHPAVPRELPQDPDHHPRAVRLPPRDSRGARDGVGRDRREARRQKTDGSKAAPATKKKD